MKQGNLFPWGQILPPLLSIGYFSNDKSLTVFIKIQSSYIVATATAHIHK